MPEFSESIRSSPGNNLTRDKDVLPKKSCTQAPKVTPSQPRSDGMAPSAAAWRCLQRVHTIRMLSGVTGVQCIFCTWWPWHSNSSELRTKHVFLWIWCESIQRFHRCLRYKQKSHRRHKTEPYLHAVIINKCSPVAKTGDRLAVIDMGRKLGAVPLLRGSWVPI